MVDWKDEGKLFVEEGGPAKSSGRARITSSQMCVRSSSGGAARGMGDPGGAGEAGMKSSGKAAGLDERDSFRVAERARWALMDSKVERRRSFELHKFRYV